MKTEKKEELQSRREFFKNAAKAALPVFGAVVLSHLPMQQAIASTGCPPTNCSGGCIGSCRGTCSHRCNGQCRDSCYVTCESGSKDW